MNALAWTFGNRVRLLENGEQYFPAVCAAIRSARREVLLETFILFEDKVGRELQAALIAAASRGAAVDVTVDGYGSSDLSDGFREELARAGVRLHVFDPRPRLFGLRTNALRRLHRKLVVIDRRHAFVGGINYAEDQLAESGPLAKQDYAVEVEGPVTEHIRALMMSALAGQWRAPFASPTLPAVVAPGARIVLAARDNHRHRDSIEKHYCAAIRTARRDVLIANAYFFPGYHLLRELRMAVRRGVRVRLILQGMPDRPLMRRAARALYNFLLRGGVHIYEYRLRPFHGKVAVVDGDWATVGSSNLDPLSLSLNLEANLVIQDRTFNGILRDRLEHLLHEHCETVDPGSVPRHGTGRRLLTSLVFHVARRFPVWIGWLPLRAQRAVRVQADAAVQEKSRRAA
ncbi:MAG: cardiolipin synthase ClsB [Sinimarinibacterium sp.]|jgi:cardiolipin synthase